MASPIAAGFAALFALAFCWIVGLPVALRLFPDRSLGLAAAPALGWALSSALALPVFCVVGFGPAAVATLAGAVFALALAALAKPPASRETSPARVPAFAYVLGLVAAATTTIALLPKEAADGVLLAAPIFDHSKVAIVDEIARNGVPARNPFYGEAGSDAGLAYYYLWHFGAAALSLLPGVSGWEADVALTAVTAFAALSLTMGLAVRLSEKRAAAFWTIALFFAGSARPALEFVFGADVFGTWLSRYPGLAGLLVQATWAPQHVAAGFCVVLAVLLIERLADEPHRLVAPALGVVAAAGFGSSIWVGGFALALAAPLVGAILFAKIDSARRRPFAIGALTAIAVEAAAAAPILIELARAAASRAGPFPVALHPYEVLGPNVPDAIRRTLDLPAYWLALLPIDFSAVYLLGATAIGGLLAAKGGLARDRNFAIVLALAALSSFGLAWLAISTVLNNDLGWRAVLPGAMLLTAFAAAGLARWTTPARRLAALALLAIALVDGAGFLAGALRGKPSTSAREFARAPALWEAVRRHSGPTDRIANNPASLAGMTPWPANIGWALLADRRSCYAGWEFARPFAQLPPAEVDRLDRDVRAVFEGGSEGDAARGLLLRLGCRFVLATAADGAWKARTFDRIQDLKLIDEAPGEWRLYRFEPTTAARD